MKFKNIKKEAKKPKSPSNPRTIPANSEMLLEIYRGSLKIFIVSVFLLAAAIVGMDLQKNLSIKEDIDIQRVSLTRELKFWEDFISKNNDYRDAYFQASILQYKLGNSSKAKMYAEKGLSLDPNSEDGREIEDFLSKLDK
jgi:tetratricopeptide (TPR) repeat protein